GSVGDELGGRQQPALARAVLLPQVAFVVEADLAGVLAPRRQRALAPPQGELGVYVREPRDVPDRAALAAAAVVPDVRVAGQALAVGQPGQGHPAAVLAVAGGAVVAAPDLLVVLRAVVATGAGLIGDGAHGLVEGPEAPGRLEVLRVALGAVVVEHGVGRRHGPGLVEPGGARQEDGPGRQGDTDEQGQPGHPPPQPPQEARAPEVIQLDPLRQ